MKDDDLSNRALTPTQRLFRLARLLRQGPCDLSELSAELHLNPETVRRDLTDLEALDPDLVCLPGRPVKYAIRQGHQLSPVELVALHSGATLLANLAGEQHPYLPQIAQQLAAHLPEHVRLGLQREEKETTVRPTRLQGNLERAVSAWLGKHPLRFEYLKPAGRRERRTSIVHPYLIQMDPVTLDMLVMGRDVTHHGELRSFRLAQMRKLDVLTDEHYEIPGHFDSSDIFHSFWGPKDTLQAPSVTVELRFTGEAKYRLLEGGHAFLSEPLINPDASLDVTLEAPLNSSGLPLSVMPWVLGWGAGVEVLSPAPLRAYWHHTLSRALETATREPQRFTRSGAA